MCRGTFPLERSAPVRFYFSWTTHDGASLKLNQFLCPAQYNTDPKYIRRRERKQAFTSPDTRFHLIPQRECHDFIAWQHLEPNHVGGGPRTPTTPPPLVNSNPRRKLQFVAAIKEQLHSLLIESKVAV